MLHFVDLMRGCCRSLMMIVVTVMRRYDAWLNFRDGIIIIIIVVVSIIIIIIRRRRTTILSSWFIGAERTGVGDAFSHGFVFGVEIFVVRVSCSCCTDDEKVLSTDAFGAFPLSRMTDEKPPTGDHGVADHEEESKSSHELCGMRRGEEKIVSRLLFRSFFFLFYPLGRGKGGLFGGG